MLEDLLTIIFVCQLRPLTNWDSYAVHDWKSGLFLLKCGWKCGWLEFFQVRMGSADSLSGIEMRIDSADGLSFQMRMESADRLDSLSGIA